MNIEDGSSDETEDVEETLRDFLELELGFHDAISVEIQRVRRSGKSKNGKARPILARFLRYKDVQKIFSLGHRFIKRNRLPNVPRLSCRNCQKTQRADEDLQRGQKKQHSCILQSIGTR